MIKPPTHLLTMILLSLLLQGCVVASAVDLAASTVLTAGKVVVKGTGALIEAAIPDGDDDKKQKKGKKSDD